MKREQCSGLVCLTAHLILSVSAAEPLSPFPVGAPFVQTGTPGASGKGSDYDALRRALDVRGAGVLLLPAGTYTLNGCLTTDALIRGEGPGKTIVRLCGSGRPPRSGAAAVLRLGAHARLEHLTVEVASDMTNACGVRIEADAALEDVEVRAAGDNGATGVVVEPGGRAALNRVRVTGFATAVHACGAGTLLTADDLTLEGQTVAGLRIDSGCAWLRRCAYRGPGQRTLCEPGTALVVDGDEGTWQQKPAVVRNGTLFGVACVEIPATPPYAFEQWVAVSDSNAPPFTVMAWGKPSPQPDYGVALQKACARGKPVVYLPPGRKYGVFSTVEVPASVRILDGLRGSLYEVYHGSGTRYAGKLVVGDGAEPLEIRNLDASKANLTIRHTGKRPLVLRHVGSFTYQAGEGAGPLFLEHATPLRIVLAKGQQAFLTDVSLDDSHGPLIENRGGTLLARGLRTAGWTTAVVNHPGARARLEGVLVVARTLRPKDPLFVAAAGSSLAASIAEWPVLGVPYERLVSDAAGSVLLRRTAGGAEATTVLAVGP